MSLYTYFELNKDFFEKSHCAMTNWLDIDYVLGYYIIKFGGGEEPPRATTVKWQLTSTVYLITCSKQRNPNPISKEITEMPFITTERSNALYAVTNRVDTVSPLLAALYTVITSPEITAALQPEFAQAIRDAIEAHTDQEKGQQKALQTLRASSDRYRPTEEEAADEISNFVNIIGFDNKKFVGKMAYEHRTLQQTFTGVCLSWLGHLSTLNENQYDARNEFSVKVAKEIATALGKAGIRLERLPCI